MKKVTKTRIIQVPHVYKVDCLIPEIEEYYENVDTPYTAECERPALKWGTKIIQVPKEVKTERQVWTGKWTGPIDCAKKVMETVIDTKTVMVDKEVPEQISYMEKYPCIKTKNVRTKRTKTVQKPSKCDKPGFIDQTETYTVEEEAERPGTVRVWEWRTKDVKYQKKVFKYRTEKRTRETYKEQVVKKWVPYFDYEVKTRTAYRLAHKKVPYQEKVETVSHTIVKRFKLVENTVPVVTRRDVCVDEIKKVKVGVKTECTESSPTSAP